MILLIWIGCWRCDAEKQIATPISSQKDSISWQESRNGNGRRQTRKDRRMWNRETRKYYCFYTLPDGKEECVVATLTSGRLNNLRHALRKKPAKCRGGLRNPTASANYKKLLVCSLCDSKGLTKEGACCECVAHLSDFRKHLKAKNNTTGYIDSRLGRLRKLFDGCGFHRTPDLSASKLPIGWRNGGKPS